MKAETFDDLMSGMSDVLEYHKGERDGFRLHEAQDVKAIRAKVGMTQPAFARAYRLEVATLRDWEQGRRSPTARRKCFSRSSTASPTRSAASSPEMVATADAAPA